MPGWWLGNAPNNQIQLASYHEKFAASWGRQARDTFAEHGKDIFGLQIRRDVASTSDWGILGHEGRMQTAGTGGPMTGKGADLLIVDDPIKNAEDANSTAKRDGLWEWWTSTAYTRLEPDGVAVVMQTRWHEADLAGRLIADMKDGGEHWTVISMPAIAEQDETWRYGQWSWSRKKGDALWPERFRAERLKQVQRSVGTYWWSALYQQRPQPLEGGLFRREWFRYFKEESREYVLKTPEGDRRIPKNLTHRFITVDLAIATNQQADYLVIGVWAVTQDSELLLLDIFRDRVPATEQIGLLRGYYEKWDPGYVGIESVAYQAFVVRTLEETGMPVKELKPDSDKVTRALTLAARMESGYVYTKASAPWLDAWEDELLHFPTGSKDDQVDVGSYAAIEVADDKRGPSMRLL